MKPLSKLQESSRTTSIRKWWHLGLEVLHLHVYLQMSDLDSKLLTFPAKDMKGHEIGQCTFREKYQDERSYTRVAESISDDQSRI